MISTCSNHQNLWKPSEFQAFLPILAIFNMFNLFNLYRELRPCSQNWWKKFAKTPNIPIKQNKLVLHNNAQIRDRPFSHYIGLRSLLTPTCHFLGNSGIPDQFSMHYHIKGGKAKCFLTENIILSTFFTKKLVFGPKIGGFRTLQKVPKMVKNDQKLAKNYLKMPKI